MEVDDPLALGGQHSEELLVTSYTLDQWFVVTSQSADQSRTYVGDW